MSSEFSVFGVISYRSWWHNKIVFRLTYDMHNVLLQLPHELGGTTKLYPELQGFEHTTRCSINKSLLILY